MADRRGGPGDPPDRRIVPVRDDLAAAHLQTIIDAPRYAEGAPYQVTASVLPIRRTPAPDGMQETQALFGELFTVYDEKDGWGWGQAAFDDYVGYVDMEGLSAPALSPTHRVRALRAYRFSAPDLKSAPLGLVSMNAKIAVGAQHGDYVADGRGGWIWHGALISMETPATDDPVSAAEQFVGAPYFWGGRESLGLDCSGLVQNAFEAAGVPVPRDADMQEAHFSDPSHGDTIYHDETRDTGLTASLRWAELDLRRGDLLFWPGHVAIMVDGARMIHANATHMATSLDDARALSAQWQATRENMALRRVLRPRSLDALRTS